MKRTVLDELLQARAAKRAMALVTDLATGAQTIVYPDAATSLSDDIKAAVGRAIQDDRSGTLDAPEGRLFIQVFTPPVRLILVGAVHIAQALAPMAALAGYAVSVVDPRRAFASDARFPDLDLSTEWPDEAMARLKPDSRTAVVTLTHDPKLDDPALAAALASDAFYIGALGSRKTHAARLGRLKEAGATDAQIARIHGPVGLAIGAASPAEIAVSIMAQITQARRGRAEAAS
ncbi:MAG: xanthine dehydrogenase [Alphaproteobacteria bacterium]|nr:xanthine dehydrogenase [Alphaproteobacteria bacterium]